MKQFEYVEDAKLGKPKTPSKWKCFPEYTLITKVRMTWRTRRRRSDMV